MTVHTPRHRAPTRANRIAEAVGSLPPLRETALDPRATITLLGVVTFASAVVASTFGGH